MGVRINTIMQTCFFKLSGVLPARRGDRRHQGLDQEDLRQAGGGKVVEQNFAAVDAAVSNLSEGEGTRRDQVTSRLHMRPAGAGKRPAVRQGRAGR
jgi:pyruvate-ferredoxin/flavodoxin oxidoreductase